MSNKRVNKLVEFDFCKIIGFQNGGNLWFATPGKRAEDLFDQLDIENIPTESFVINNINKNEYVPEMVSLSFIFNNLYLCTSK